VTRSATLLLGLAGVAALNGCGAATDTATRAGDRAPLPAGARPVGPGPRFRPPLRPLAVPGCRPGLGGRAGVHLELFAHGLVVLFPAGIGTRPPRRWVAGRIAGARCYGALATIDPTGLVLLRPGTRATVAGVFAAWGRPLATAGAAGFRGRIRAWVDGRRWRGRPGSIPLRRHAEIVLEVGRYVPPHRRYRFPRGY
jgi:hypothetical protein